LKAASLARSSSAWVALAAAFLGVSYLAGGASGLGGAALGLGGAGFCVTGLWLLVRLLANAASRGLKPGLGVLLTILALLAKIPVYVVLAGYARGIGGGAPPCFVVGLVLVYFAFVAWAAAR